MARQVNIWTGGWRATGNNVQVPQYETTIRFQWTRNDGTARDEERTVRFPNVLNGIPAARLKEYIEHILLAEARILAGVDDDGN